jgi:hypothetical protein
MSDNPHRINPNYQYPAFQTASTSSQTYTTIPAHIESNPTYPFDHTYLSQSQSYGAWGTPTEGKGIAARASHPAGTVTDVAPLFLLSTSLNFNPAALTEHYQRNPGDGLNVYRQQASSTFAIPMQPMYRQQYHNDQIQPHRPQQHDSPAQPGFYATSFPQVSPALLQNRDVANRGQLVTALAIHRMLPGTDTESGSSVS